MNALWPVRGTTTTPSRIWKTGQTTSYVPTDDGELHMGAEWPTPRFFLNNDNATVIDLITGLTWMRGAETPTLAECTGGMMTWQEALDYIACLNSHNYLGRSDWRLPNRKARARSIGLSLRVVQSLGARQYHQLRKIAD